MDPLSDQVTVLLDVSPNSTDTKLHYALLGIYSFVFISGLICFSLAVHVLKSSNTSITSVAVFNLMITHFVFLLTVPFRIYYYSTHDWTLGLKWCKVVSSVIHVHMYMSFIFYVIILVSRLWSFYHKSENVPSVQRLHAVLISVAVWIVVLVTVPCVVTFIYGKTVEDLSGNNTISQCFTFADDLKSTSAKVSNYMISTLIIVTTAVLTILQANVLLLLYRRDGEKCVLQQDFSAQLKSLFFALIMVASFVPYHIFRLYYIEHLRLEGVNEVFLSLTTFNCLDALTFLGRRTCVGCCFSEGSCSRCLSYLKI